MAPRRSASSPAGGGRPHRTDGVESQRTRRARILDAALSLLDDRDYAHIRVRDVAGTADVALATLYRYFPSKERLFAEAFLAWTTGLEAKVTSGTTIAGEPAAELTRTLRAVCRAFERHPNYYGLVRVLEVSDDPMVVESFGRYRDGFTGVLLHALSGVEHDDARAVADLMAAQVGTLLRLWSMDRLAMPTVVAQLERSVGLVFGAPRCRQEQAPRPATRSNASTPARDR